LLSLDPQFAALLPEQERSFDALLALSGTVVRSREGRTTIRFSRAGHEFFIKQHRGVGWAEITKNLTSLRLPALSARSEWEAIARVQAAGIATPRVVGRGLRGCNPARLQSFLITEALNDTLTLAELTDSWRGDLPDPALKRALIREVAQIARRMHQAGIAHRDFYLVHFRRARTGGPLHLMDLHRAKLSRPLRRRWIVKDLGGLLSSAGSLALTRRDLYRFMTVYCSKPLRQTLREDATLWADVARNATALRLRGRHPLVGALLLRWRPFARVYRAFVPDSNAR
jgi:heptose I phosphotransferase